MSEDMNEIEQAAVRAMRGSGGDRAALWLVSIFTIIAAPPFFAALGGALIGAMFSPLVAFVAWIAGASDVRGSTLSWSVGIAVAWALVLLIKSYVKMAGAWRK